MRNEKLRLQRKGIKILASDAEFIFPDFAVCARVDWAEKKDPWSNNFKCAALRVRGAHPPTVGAILSL